MRDADVVPAPYGDEAGRTGARGQEPSAVLGLPLPAAGGMMGSEATGGAAAVLRWLDRSVEFVLMNVTYGLCTLIIFVEASRRYLFRAQEPWAPSVAVYLFIWLSWIACAYAVKTRCHIRFDEIRKRLPRRFQFVLQLVDYALWLLLGSVVIFYSIKQILLQASLGSLIQGTDSVPLWLVFIGLPFGWVLVMLRAVQCAVQDVRRFRAGHPVIDAFALDEVG
jgi:TRAP-type C4-dicarboxylate transport system permease small subunit